jgi:hypothetical protein
MINSRGVHQKRFNTSPISALPLLKLTRRDVALPQVPVKTHRQIGGTHHGDAE